MPLPETTPTYNQLVPHCSEMFIHYPHNGPVMRSFVAVFAVSLNKLFNKQSIWDAVTLTWRHCDKSQGVDGWG